MADAKVLIPIGLCTAGAIILLKKRAKSQEPEGETPPIIEPGDTTPVTVAQILAASSLDELTGYYYQIDDLFFHGQITTTQYQELYDAYSQRYFELAEA